MENAFRALLTGSAAVAVLVPQQSINFGIHPQGAPLPAIVLNVIHDRSGHTYRGPDGLSQGRVQLDCYGEVYVSAKGLSNTVRDLLDGYRGGRFEGIFLIAARDHHETGATDRPYRVSLDFSTHWRMS